MPLSTLLGAHTDPVQKVPSVSHCIYTATLSARIPKANPLHDESTWKKKKENHLLFNGFHLAPAIFKVLFDSIAENTELMPFSQTKLDVKRFSRRFQTMIKIHTLNIQLGAWRPCVKCMKPNSVPFRSKTNTCLESAVRTLLVFFWPRPKYCTWTKSAVWNYYPWEGPLQRLWLPRHTQHAYPYPARLGERQSAPLSALERASPEN